MNEENNGMVTPQNKAKTELQKALQKIPDDILLAAIADRIKRTPDEKFKAVVQTVISQQIFSGPIPPPEVLAGYASAGPDIAERIVKMAESQQRHMQEMEKKAIEASIGTEKRGQYCALIAALVTILGAVYLMGNEKGIYGLSLIISAVAGLVYAFITGKKKEKKESD